MAEPTPIQNLEYNKLAASIEQFRRNAELIIENNKIMAKIRRETFKAYLKEGFAKPQALELCAK